MTKLPPTDTGACGTHRGYMRHYRRRERGCRECRDAVNQYTKARTQRPELDPTAAEIAEEIEHLHRLGQGTHYILQAIKCSNIHSLQDRLRHNGHHKAATILQGAA